MKSSHASPSLAGSEDWAFAHLIEELTACLRTGNASAVEDFLEARPQHTGELRQLLPALRGLAELERSGTPGAVPPEDPDVHRLGDFCLRREVGRGGMGIVYEAEQISLGRRVALKVLPFAATMDSRQLQRFHNEARAAASLHHEHIVPVYWVGCERGVHFYAMQFVEGQSLADVISALRAAVSASKAFGEVGSETVVLAGTHTPFAPREAGFYRTAAQWGIQAAMALDHAHRLGIVHRDVKPANLMIDGQGKLWVTDFGLARTADSGLTLTGDVVGTVRYMSPEQALAEHGLVDHRTDVYSLGVTLYELLTQRPAIDGKDRQEILRKLASEDPLAPRRINQAVPADLETVITKAMSKEPAERYGSAQELADDLRHFLDDKPIRAKRPGVVGRARKWARRHTALVRAAMVSLGLAVVVLAAATAINFRAYEREAGERQRAQRNLDFAARVLDDLYVDLVERRLPTRSTITPEDREVLQKALPYFEQLADQAPVGPDGQVRAAQAQKRVGIILIKLGEDERAGEAFAKAITRLEPLAAGPSPAPEVLSDLADCCLNLGITCRSRRLWPQAEAAIRQAIDQVLRYVRVRPDDLLARQGLYRAYLALGVVLQETGRMPQGHDTLRQALTIAEGLCNDFPFDPTCQQYHAAGCMNLMNARLEARDLAEAEKYGRLALAGFERLVKEHAASAAYKASLRDAQTNFGRLMASSNRLPEAEKPFQTARWLAVELTGEAPNLVEHWDASLRAHSNLAQLLMATGQRAEAEAVYREAVKISEETVRRFATTPDRSGLLSGCYLSLSYLLMREGRIAEAAQKARAGLHADPQSHSLQAALARLLAMHGSEPATSGEAVELASKAVKAAPDHADHWNTLGHAHCRAGNWVASVSALQKSIELRPPGDPWDWLPLAVALARLDRGAEASLYYELAVQAIGIEESTHPTLRRLRDEAADLLGARPMKKPPND